MVSSCESKFDTYKNIYLYLIPCKSHLVMLFISILIFNTYDAISLSTQLKNYINFKWYMDYHNYDVWNSELISEYDAENQSN